MKISKIMSIIDSIKQINNTVDELDDEDIDELIAEEYDAIADYQEALKITTNEHAREQLTHIMEEEKEHVRELEALKAKREEYVTDTPAPSQWKPLEKRGISKEKAKKLSSEEASKIIHQGEKNSKEASKKSEESSKEVSKKEESKQENVSENLTKQEELTFKKTLTNHKYLAEKIDELSNELAKHGEVRLPYDLCKELEKEGFHIYEWSMPRGQSGYGVRTQAEHNRVQEYTRQQAEKRKQASLSEKQVDEIMSKSNALQSAVNNYRQLLSSTTSQETPEFLEKQDKAGVKVNNATHEILNSMGFDTSKMSSSSHGLVLTLNSKDVPAENESNFEYLMNTRLKNLGFSNKEIDKIFTYTDKWNRKTDEHTKTYLIRALELFNAFNSKKSK